MENFLFHGQFLDLFQKQSWDPSGFRKSYDFILYRQLGHVPGSPKNKQLFLSITIVPDSSNRYSDNERLRFYTVRLAVTFRYLQGWSSPVEIGLYF